MEGLKEEIKSLRSHCIPWKQKLIKKEASDRDSSLCALLREREREVLPTTLSGPNVPTRKVKPGITYIVGSSHWPPVGEQLNKH